MTEKESKLIAKISILWMLLFLFGTTSISLPDESATNKTDLQIEGNNYLYCPATDYLRRVADSTYTGNTGIDKESDYPGRNEIRH